MFMDTYAAVYYIYTLYENKPIRVTFSGYHSLSEAESDAFEALRDIALAYDLYDEDIWVEIDYYIDYDGVFDYSEYIYTESLDVYVSCSQNIYEY